MLVRLIRYFSSRTYFTNHDWPENQKPLFFNTYGEKLNKTTIQKFITDAFKRTDLKAASAHRLRHGNAFSVLRSEHGQSILDNLVILQRTLGHSSLETTQLYTHVPAHMLNRMNVDTHTGEMKFRFEEAQLIFEQTYIPEKSLPKVRKIGRG